MDLVNQLDRLFYPKAIAIVGASANPEKVGFICLSNLLDAGFKGKIYPINPSLSEVLGLKAYPSLGAIPDEVDLALVVIPAQQTVAAIEECAANRVKAAIIISSGFKELGTETGEDLQAKLREIANRGGLKITGPNTLGVLNPRANLVASFASSLSLSKIGDVAIASQSGGMCVYFVHALTNCNVGISKAIGLGNRCNLDFDEVVTYLAEDEETKIIVLYIEGLEQPRQLMRAARKAVKQKPILVYKGGRNNKESDKSTLSHTGALAGKYELYKAAFNQSGMITVDNITELVDIVKALDLQPPASGNRIAILSVQAGPAIVIADKCHELGLRLAELSPATKRQLRQLISPLNPVDNPVDIAWESTELDTSRSTLKALLDDNGVDALIVAAAFWSPNMELMKAVADTAKHSPKPIVACLDSPLGAASVYLNALDENGIPTYPAPERAVTGLAGLVRYGEILNR